MSAWILSGCIVFYEVLVVGGLGSADSMAGDGGWVLEVFRTRLAKRRWGFGV
jgi:hypothetical protein